MKIKLQNRNAGYRLLRLLLPFLLAFGGMVVLVALVRSEALAQGIETQSGLNQPPLQPQNGGVDLSITKTHETRFFVGDVGTYTIYVKNVGIAIPNPYTITITDTLPAPLEYQGFKGNGWQCPTTSPKVVCRFVLTQTLNPNELLPLLQISVKLKPATSQTVNNVVVISDTAGTNNKFTDLTDISTNLSIKKNAYPVELRPGDNIVFTLTLKNNGPNDTTNIKVTDTIPSKLIFKGASATAGQYNQTTGLWTLDNLAKDKSEKLVITSTVKEETCGRVYTNTVQGLSSDLLDSDTSDNTSAITFTVKNTCVVAKIIRADTKQAVPNANVKLIYGINKFMPSVESSGIYTFANSSKLPLGTGAFTVTAYASGFLTGTMSSELDQDKIRIITITLYPASVQKLLNDIYIVPNKVYTYTIPINNHGAINIKSLVITDSLPSPINFITYTLKEGGTSLASGFSKPTSSAPFYKWTITNTNLNTTTINLSIRFTMTENTSNKLENIVFVKYQDASQSSQTISATNIAYSPNVKITQKDIIPHEYKLNDWVTFVYTISNENPYVDAKGVEFTTTLPSYLGNISINSSASGSTPKVTLGDLKKSDRAKTVTISAQVVSAPSSSQDFTSVGYLKFTHGTTPQWRSSNTVQYRILASSTLPGTGFGPPAIVQEGKGLSNLQSWLVYSFLPSPLGRGVGGEGIFSSPLRRGVGGEGFQSIFDFPIAFWVALGIGVILLGAGLLAIAYSRTSRETEWSTWARQMGIVLALASLLFFGGAWWIGQTVEPSTVAVVLPTPTQTSMPQANQPDVPIFPPPEWWDAQHEQLPNYPIPTPTLTPEQAATAVDDTPPTRLLIPKLGLDAVVKYVPFDGFSWLISGLQNEVAWMGSTSWPGLGSNTGLAGHVTLRNGADGPFRYLETLQKGDLIRLYTQEGLYTYRVQESLVVKDDDLSVVQPTEEAILTLITCASWNNDFGRYLERLVVHARLEKSQPLSGFSPNQLPVWGYGLVGGN